MKGCLPVCRVSASLHALIMHLAEQGLKLHVVPSVDQLTDSRVTPAAVHRPFPPAMVAVLPPPDQIASVVYFHTSTIDPYLVEHACMLLSHSSLCMQSMKLLACAHGVLCSIKAFGIVPHRGFYYCQFACVALRSSAHSPRYNPFICA